MLTHGSLFTGIGGFDLGFERVGFTTLWQVEIDDYATKVLEKHWPAVQRFRDIRTIGQHNLAVPTVITGGFPCQPFSVAGKRRGTADDRYLWLEMRRVIDEVRPRWVVAENVPGLIKLALDQVLSDLEALGYAIKAVTIPACAVDAPHRRERLWIVASHHDSTRQWQQTDADAKTQSNGGTEAASSRCTRWPPEPGVGRVVHGIPHRVDRLKCLGNAIVPQIAEVIGQLIVEAERRAQDGKG